MYSSLLFGNSPSEIMLSAFEWQLQIISHFCSLRYYYYYYSGCHPWLAQRLAIKLHKWSVAASGHMLTLCICIQMITKHNRHQLSWTWSSDRGIILETRIQLLCVNTFQPYLFNDRNQHFGHLCQIWFDVDPADTRDTPTVPQHPTQ